MFVPGCPAGHAVTPEGDLLTLLPEMRGDRWRHTDGKCWWSEAPLAEGPGHEQEE